jgi:Ca2+-binding EF-hand superfamily protein
VRKQWKIIFGIAGLLAAGTAVPTAITAQDSSSSAARKEKKIAAGEKEAKKLLLLMDKDQNGKVSKQEFMSFMEAEFDRLDKDKSGELDVKELTEVQVRTRSPISR